MPKSHSHSKRSGSEPARTDVEASAEDLRAQVAALADQVRRLGKGAADRNPEQTAAETFDAIRVDAWVSGPEEEPPAAPPPLPRGAPTGATATATQAEPSAPEAEGEAETTPVREHAGEGDSFADRSTRLVSSVVTLAELAAIELRTGAEIQAAAIRGRSRERLDEPTVDYLLVLLDRQRRMLAALAVQTERIERAGAVVRAQILALEAEREHLHELLAYERPTTP
jgi:hypothetical protein